MKDISLYTVMVSLKLKEKRELQNWAKKTLSQKYRQCSKGVPEIPPGRSRS